MVVLASDGEPCRFEGRILMDAVDTESLIFHRGRIGGACPVFPRGGATGNR